MTMRYFSLISACVCLLVGPGERSSSGQDVVAATPRQEQVVTLADRNYRAVLLFEDDFNSLRNWLLETEGSGRIRDGWFYFECMREGERPGGTAWCRQRFEGNTLITYEVRTIEGQDNINMFAYADVGGEDLLATTERRGGAYNEYHGFQNYIVTYLKDTEHSGKWRIRFRKDPGFNLLSEKRISQSVPDSAVQRVAYAFDDDGWIRLYVEGSLIHEFQDEENEYRSGYHGLRTYNSRLEYDNFRVYLIQSSAASDSSD